MPVPTIPGIIPMPFAHEGQKNVIQESSDSTTNPAATWSAGFPPITMINKQAGGKPPYGLDFNGLFNALSQHLFFQQSGGVYPWNAGLNYLAGAHILGSDGNEYIALTPSGPDVPAVGGSGVVGPVDPVGDTSGVWSKVETNASSFLPSSSPTILTASGTWTAPMSRYYWITVVGGGGGGAGGSGYDDFIAGGPGGGSGYVSQFVKWYDAGMEVDYTIGAGGAGGATTISTTQGGLDGGDGGSSTFDGVTAFGGKGAQGSGLNITSNALGGYGVGRNNGFLGINYYSGTPLSTRQAPGGNGGSGFSDLTGGVISYGAGGTGGNACAMPAGIVNGRMGGDGAVIIR